MIIPSSFRALRKTACMTRLLRRMLLAPARLFSSAFNTADADMPPHDPARHTQCPRHGVQESRTRLAQHSVAARQDLRGTRLPSLFYCNRKPPLSASGQHRFMKHPAPIFKTKAPHRHLTPPSILAVHLEKTRIFRQIGSEKLYSWGRGKFVKKLYKKESSPIILSSLRKLTFLNRWGRACFVQKLNKSSPSPSVQNLFGCA